MAFQSFGAWKRSLLGDMTVHGPEGVRCYARLKAMTARARRMLQSERIQFMTEGPVALSASSVRTEVGGRRTDEASSASSTEVTLRPPGGDLGT